MGGLAAGLAAGVGIGLVYGLAIESVEGLFYGLVNGLAGGLGAGLGVRLVGYSNEIKPVDKIRWSWPGAQDKWINKLYRRLLCGLGAGLVVGLGFGLFGWLVVGWSFWLPGLSFGLNFGLARRSW